MTEAQWVAQPSRIRERLTAEAVFYLGEDIQYLVRANKGALVVYKDGSIEKGEYGFILAILKKLETRLQRYGLADTEHLRLTTLIREFEEQYAKPNAPKLSEADRQELRKTTEVIEAVVIQELLGRNFAELTPLEGILDYKKLLSEEAKGLLIEGGKEPPKVVIHDLEETTKCLSYGAPTASVMIGLRAVEGMVRELHQTITGKKSTKAWANLIDEVEKDLKNKGKQPPLLLGYLKYIKDVRNKADHPDKVFTQREAEQIFMHVVYTIQEIQKL
jgi:hypothetical protein